MTSLHLCFIFFPLVAQIFKDLDGKQTFFPFIESETIFHGMA